MWARRLLLVNSAFRSNAESSQRSEFAHSDERTKEFSPIKLVRMRFIVEVPMKSTVDNGCVTALLTSAAFGAGPHLPGAF
ncbi:hypothetical protein CQW49_09580 [Methylosinus trichosporium OB3b]|uniref:Uncharacterized protein n=1 Tax=Methylosinus trichosporium (strain ATCC 35070 / NCIMB 11131 / UNIQEM 75 / OB3b) TaxID=595536 RepID=A0A2D2CZE5_METT3|nr:hypothetical protein CQW49_09580 [Methylosinus trichosporium OB3b]